MIGALTYEEVLRATMRSNWIHALWLFAVVVLIWVCTILLTLYGNRKKKPKGKDDSWQVSVFLLVLVVIGYGICVGTSVPEENARIQQDIDEHAYITVHGSYTRNTASRRRCLQKKRHALTCLFFWRRHPDLNRGSRICSPMPYHLAMAPKNGAGNEIRTRYLHLGKVALCQMSYARKMVPPVGIEPTTRGFSVPCSTN